MKRAIEFAIKIITYFIVSMLMLRKGVLCFIFLLFVIFSIVSFTGSSEDSSGTILKGNIGVDQSYPNGYLTELIEGATVYWDYNAVYSKSSEAAKVDFFITDESNQDLSDDNHLVAIEDESQDKGSIVIPETKIYAVIWRGNSDTMADVAYELSYDPIENDNSLCCLSSIIVVGGIAIVGLFCGLLLKRN